MLCLSLPMYCGAVKIAYLWGCLKLAGRVSIR